MELLNKENRRAFEKIINQMNKYDFSPNDTIYELILNICDKYHYPYLLKNYTDDIVLNKNFILSGKNFTKYIHILSMFKETEEYVINLVESSYTDFKLPIKSEYYEYLIFKSILQGEYKKINSHIESLFKRYLSDFPTEKIKNSETYSGNIYLINSLEDIIEDFKQNEEYRSNLHQGVSLNEAEINKIINELIQSCKEVNKTWYQDEKFIKLIYIFYSKINFNHEELRNLLDEIVNNPKIDSTFIKEIVNGMYKNTFDKFLLLIKQNKEMEVRKSIYLLTNILKNNSSKLISENKDICFKVENIRKIINFIRDNPTIENKEAFKNFIKDSLEIKKLSNINFIDIDEIRRLAYIVYEDRRQVSNLFEENNPRFVNNRNTYDF